MTHDELVGAVEDLRNRIANCNMHRDRIRNNGCSMHDFNALEYEGKATINLFVREYNNGTFKRALWNIANKEVADLEAFVNKRLTIIDTPECSNYGCEKDKSGCTRFCMDCTYGKKNS